MSINLIFSDTLENVFPSVQYLIRPSWDFKASSKIFRTPSSYEFTCQIYINGDKEIKKAGIVMKNAVI